MPFILPDDLMGLLLTHVSYKEHKFIRLHQLHLLRQSHRHVSYNLTKYHVRYIPTLLKDSRVDPSVNDNCAIVYYSRRGKIDIVRLLLTYKNVDPSVDNNKAICMASLCGHIDIVSLLLSDRHGDLPSELPAAAQSSIEARPKVDPSDRSNYAIRTASGHGRIEIIRILLADERVDPSDNNNRAIIRACTRGHTEIAKLLLDHRSNRFTRVNPSACNNRAIRLASKNGHIETVRLLLTDGRVRPSAVDNYAHTHAILGGYTEIAEMLKADHRYRDNGW